MLIRVGSLLATVAAIAFCSGGLAVAEGSLDLAQQARALFDVQAPELKARVTGRDTLKLADRGASVVSLDNVRAQCEARATDCQQVLRDFVSRLVAMSRNPGALSAVQVERVYPVLRSRTFVAMTRRLLAQGPKPTVPLTEPFDGDAEVAYVLDSPDAIRVVNDADLARLGLTMEQVHAQAFSNTRKLASLQLQALRGVPGVYSLVTQDALGTARLFDADLWARVEAELGGAVVVAAPTRDWLLVGRLDDDNVVAAIEALAKRYYDGEAYAVSSAVFRRQAGNWVTVKP